jgi:farnesyl diphosphate synthase
MDDDDFRRGEPTCHKKFDEATAILAGDALLTYAFELLANPATNKDASTRCQLISILAKASGFAGMVGGQMMDLEKAGQKISKETVAKLHRLKTGELFMAAAEMGAVLGNAGPEQRKALRYFARDLGLAFQIKDDILDHVETVDDKTDIDEKQHEESQENASIVDIVGLGQAKKQLELLKDQAISHLNVFGERAALLADLTDFVVGRKI